MKKAIASFLYEQLMRMKSELCVFSFIDTSEWPMEAMWFAGRWISKDDQYYSTYREVLQARFLKELARG